MFPEVRVQGWGRKIKRIGVRRGTYLLVRQCEQSWML
jgi:hypothetical protein